ncbi:toxin VasX [Pseudomonas sp. DWP3-1-2]|uniref:toxin VasX n=1 Tax=Pseudomonas sp. DWP3-1-2 TaxID=2804645 RepID=UPI003CE999A6
MKRTVQFLPLRYGLVDNLQPGRDIPMPHELQSRSMGLRLLRDGYLYIIDNASGYLHEYRIEQGSVSKLLWKGAQVSADNRTNAIGEPDLVFARHGALHVAYSEFQWTAYKCSQVIGQPPERDQYMQFISFSEIDCKKVGAHLLTEKQTRNWLAETAETPLARNLPEGADPEENKPYYWEHKPLYRKAWIEELTSQVNAAHKHDFLFLVVRDDIGVMLDLAAAQVKVADWIGRWSNDDDTQLKYLTGAYIQSMYQVNQKRLNQLASKDKRYQTLLDDTDEDQREKIFEYLRVKRDYRGPTLLGDEQSWRNQAHHNPLAKATVELRDALGTQLLDKHGPTITDLELATWYALSGKEIGERGIHQLVHREPMEAFVLKHQKLLSHWRSQLKKIRADRLKMIVEGHFHRAAWYYDFRQSEQIQHRLEREFNCVAAICDDEQATEQLQAYLEKNPLVQVPGLNTLNLADQADIRKKLAALSDFSIKLADAPGVVRDMDVLANQFNSLMRQSLPNFDNLNTRFSGLNSMLGSAYDPARQLRVAARLAQAQVDFQRGALIDPNDFIRNIGPVARLRLLSAYASSGLQLRVASASEVELFNRDRSAALALRADLRALYKERREKLRGQMTDADPISARQRLNDTINFLKYQLAPIEERLSLALTPGGGAGQFGLVLGNMDPQLNEEMRRTVNDYRSTGTFKGPIRGVLHSRGDQIAVVLFYFQAMKFLDVASKITSKEDRGWKDVFDIGESLMTTFSAGFAAAQGLSINILQAHIGEMESAGGKLNTMSYLGKWSAFTGVGTFIFGAVSAAIDLSKHSKQWANALSEGDSKRLAATSLQISGDTFLLGTHSWAFKHTYSITKEIVRMPAHMRALAWAERSPQLVGIATRANLIGIAATALQLLGEGFFNYLNLDALNTWVLHSAWGRQSLGLSLEEDWRKLASIVQQPVCQLIRTDHSTELRITFPGVRSDEMERRKIWIEALQRQKDYSGSYGSQNPVYWAVCSEALAGQLKRVGPGEGALVLSLDLRPLISDHFGLAIAVSYNLEEHRDINHRSTFHVLDLHRQQVEGRWQPRKGIFAYKAETEESMQLKPTPPWLLREVDLDTPDVK